MEHEACFTVSLRWGYAKESWTKRRQGTCWQADREETTSEMWEHILLLLPLALQPTVAFGLSNNSLPFFPIYHQLSPSSHSQHLKISFYFLFPSFPGSSPSSRPFQFLGEDLLGILPSSILSRWPNQLILCPFIHFTIFFPLFISSSSRFVLLFHSPFSYLGPYILLNIFLSKTRWACSY